MANEAQAKAWNEDIGQAWLRHEQRIMQVSADHGRATMDALAIAAGERILDIGCGTGGTTSELAERTGPAGYAVGLDISPLLIERAREQVVSPNVEFAVADAQVFEASEPFDAAFSRFGVMFFEDPERAFANIRKALRPAGRLAFSCWRTPPENAWMSVPTLAAMGVFGPPTEMMDPSAPGPFALADTERVRAILGAAGFTDVEVRPVDTEAVYSLRDDDLQQALEFGPFRDAFAAADDDTKARARDAVRQAAEPYQRGDEIHFPAASWTVTATN